MPLILRYPFHRSNAHLRSAVDFYHALFSLWIYVVQDQATNYAPLPGRGNTGNSRAEEEEERLVNHKLHILQQAVELSNAMTAARSAFPYRDNMHLIRLQAMVFVWLADLIDGYSEYAERLGDDEKGEELRSKIESNASEITIPSDALDVGETLGRSTELRATARGLFDRLEERENDNLED